MSETRTTLLPGQPLPLPRDARVKAGRGTYSQGGYTVSSLVGHCNDVDAQRASDAPVTVQSSKTPLVVPSPDSTVRAREFRL